MDESKKTGSVDEPASGAGVTGHRVLLAVTGPRGVEEVECTARAAVGAGFDGIEWSVPVATLESYSPKSGGDAVSASGSIIGKGVAFAISIPWSPGGGEAASPALADWLEWAYLAEVRLIRLAVGGGPGTPPSSCGADVENRLFDLLRANRFATEAAGVEIAVDGSAFGCALGSSILRELIDAVGSFAVGACVTARSHGGAEDLAAEASLLGYRVKMIRAGFSGSSAAGSRGVGGEETLDMRLRDATACIGKRITIVADGVIDPAKAYGLVAQSLPRVCLTE